MRPDALLLAIAFLSVALALAYVSIRYPRFDAGRPGVLR